MGRVADSNSGCGLTIGSLMRRWLWRRSRLVFELWPAGVMSPLIAMVKHWGGVEVSDARHVLVPVVIVLDVMHSAKNSINIQF